MQLARQHVWPMTTSSATRPSTMTDGVSFELVDDMAVQFGRAKGFVLSSFVTSSGTGDDQSVVKFLQCEEKGWGACVRACGETRSEWFHYVAMKLADAGYHLESKSEKEAWFVRPLIDVRQSNAELRLLERLRSDGRAERWPRRTALDRRRGRRGHSIREWAEIIRATRRSTVAWDFCETSFARRGSICRGDLVLKAEVKARAFADASRSSSVRVAASVRMSGPRNRANAIPSAVRRQLCGKLGELGYEVVGVHAARGSKSASRDIVLARKVLENTSVAAGESVQAFDALLEVGRSRR